MKSCSLTAQYLNHQKIDSLFRRHGGKAMAKSSFLKGPQATT